LAALTAEASTKMKSLLRHLELTIKSRSGFDSGVLLLGLGAALAAALTFAFLLVAAFIGIANRHGPLNAALILGGFFLLVTIIAVLGCVSARRRTMAGAQLALAARSQTPWLDPRYIGVGMQIGRAIGWRRLVPLAAVGVLAAGIAKEWIGHNRAAGETR
jgi:hypothetical protein